MGLTLVVAAFALPSSIGARDSSSTFSLSAVRNLDTAAIWKRSNGSAYHPPKDHLDQRWMIPIGIGTPPKIFNLWVDTGSSVLWLFGHRTPANYTAGHNVHNPSHSTSSSKLEGSSFEVTWGGLWDPGSIYARGDVYTDVFTVGGLSIDNQTFGASDIFSPGLASDMALDGMLGLSPAGGLEGITDWWSKKSFLQMARPLLDSPVFTIDYQSDECKSSYRSLYAQDI